MNVHFLLLKVSLKIIEILNGRLVPVVVTLVDPLGFAQGKPLFYKKLYLFPIIIRVKNPLFDLYLLV